MTQQGLICSSINQPNLIIYLPHILLVFQSFCPFFSSLCHSCLFLLLLLPIIDFSLLSTTGLSHQKKHIASVNMGMKNLQSVSRGHSLLINEIGRHSSPHLIGRSSAVSCLCATKWRLSISGKGIRDGEVCYSSELKAQRKLREIERRFVISIYIT